MEPSYTVGENVVALENSLRMAQKVKQLSYGHKCTPISSVALPCLTLCDPMAWRILSIPKRYKRYIPKRYKHMSMQKPVNECSQQHYSQ